MSGNVAEELQQNEEEKLQQQQFEENLALATQAVKNMENWNAAGRPDPAVTGWKPDNDNIDDNTPGNGTLGYINDDHNTGGNPAAGQDVDGHDLVVNETHGHNNAGAENSSMDDTVIEDADPLDDAEGTPQSASALPTCTIIPNTRISAPTMMPVSGSAASPSPMGPSKTSTKAKGRWRRFTRKSKGKSNAPKNGQGAIQALDSGTNNPNQKENVALAPKKGSLNLSKDKSLNSDKQETKAMATSIPASTNNATTTTRRFSLRLNQKLKAVPTAAAATAATITSVADTEEFRQTSDALPSGSTAPVTAATTATAAIPLANTEEASQTTVALPSGSTAPETVIESTHRGTKRKQPANQAVKPLFKRVRLKSSIPTYDPSRRRVGLAPSPEIAPHDRSSPSPQPQIQPTAKPTTVTSKTPLGQKCPATQQKMGSTSPQTHPSSGLTESLSTAVSEQGASSTNTSGGISVRRSERIGRRMTLSYSSSTATPGPSGHKTKMSLSPLTPSCGASSKTSETTLLPTACGVAALVPGCGIGSEDKGSRKKSASSSLLSNTVPVSSSTSFPSFGPHSTPPTPLIREVASVAKAEPVSGSVTERALAITSPTGTSRLQSIDIPTRRSCAGLSAGIREGSTGFANRTKLPKPEIVERRISIPKSRTPSPLVVMDFQKRKRKVADVDEEDNSTVDQLPTSSLSLNLEINHGVATRKKNQKRVHFQDEEDIQNSVIVRDGSEIVTAVRSDNNVEHDVSTDGLNIRGGEMMNEDGVVEHQASLKMNLHWELTPTSSESEEQMGETEHGDNSSDGDEFYDASTESFDISTGSSEQDVEDGDSPLLHAAPNAIAESRVEIVRQGQVQLQGLYGSGDVEFDLEDQFALNAYYTPEDDDEELQGGKGRCVVM